MFTSIPYIESPIFVSDYPLSQWFLKQCALQLDFPAYVLYIYEATFALESSFNLHYIQVWVTENPHVHVHTATRPCAFEKRISVNVWAGIGNNFLIGTYILTTFLILTTFDYNINYKMMLQNQLSFVIICSFSMMVH